MNNFRPTGFAFGVTAAATGLIKAIDSMFSRPAPPKKKENRIAVSMPDGHIDECIFELNECLHGLKELLRGELDSLKAARPDLSKELATGGDIHKHLYQDLIEKLEHFRKDEMPAILKRYYDRDFYLN